MTKMYGVELHLVAQAATGDRKLTSSEITDHVALVMDHMADCEETDDRLLDWSISSDGDTGLVVIEVTTGVDDIAEALALTRTWARTAIHAAGGWTPGWDGDAGASLVAYEFTPEGANVRPMVDA